MNLPSNFRHLLPGLAAGVLLSGGPVAHADGVQSLRSIRAAAEKYLRARMPADGHGIIVTAGELDSRLRLSQCLEPLQASVVAGTQLQARSAVGVSCRRGATWTVYVPVTVETGIPALVLRAPAVRGARLTAADVVTENRRVAGLAVGYVTDANMLERHTLSRPLPAGSVLTTDALVADFIVRQGEQVTLLASAGGIEVRAKGRALTDGRDGARVRVQNLESLKVVEGVVDASRVIHVTP